MKIYDDLTPLQKDLAVDKALEILVKMLISEQFDYTFKSVLAQKHFYDALAVNTSWNGYYVKSGFEVAMESDEIAEELYPAAESMAELAYYPTNEDYVLKGIAK